MAKRPINYTSRDFTSIKEDLVNYAQRYYPTTFKDFSEASFGALMLDMVAYVGDQLSFYTDFQTNEGFLDSAIQYDSINRLSNILGYKTPGAAQSTGQAAFYIIAPADARTDVSTGNPTFFAVRAYGQVVSGQRYTDTITIGDYIRFNRQKLSKENITEVLSVVDNQGNEYYQVDFLTQDVIIQEFKNTTSDRIAVPYIMKIKPVPRRFVTEHTSQGETFIQFGYGSANNLTGNVVADPSDVVLDVTGRQYVSDLTFDPTNLIQTDKFGVVPTDTVLTVRYTANTSDEVNLAVDALRSVVSPQLSFKNQALLDPALVSSVIASMEVENEEPILGDTSILTGEEIKQRAYGTFASQNRAVTRTDYINLIYRMPSKFGKIKRANVVRDVDSLKRNLNVYLLSENSVGNLVQPNQTLKQNTRIWLNKYRMINDTIDILDAKIINIGINFKVLPELDVNRYELLETCVQKLKDEYLNIKFNVGEAVYISEIYKLLNEVPGVVDTMEVELFNTVGGLYSNYRFNINSNLSDDGRFLVVPEGAAAEVLFPSTDIVGAVT